MSSKGLRLLINIYKHQRSIGRHSYITKMNKRLSSVTQ